MAALVRAIITTTWPHRFQDGELRDDVSLGEDGLGLDSVEIVELILNCEERCGHPATDQLFATTPLTIERVAEHFSDA